VDGAGRAEEARPLPGHVHFGRCVHGGHAHQGVGNLNLGVRFDGQYFGNVALQVLNDLNPLDRRPVDRHVANPVLDMFNDGRLDPTLQ
jgi:hypothetical protein